MFDLTNNFFAANEIDILKKFRDPNGLALSAYLDLRCAYHKKNIFNIVNELVRSQLENLETTKENEQDIQEDLELIKLYLKTKDNLNATGIVIFSCAPKLFWRAYPVPVPIDMDLYIGSELNIDPLLQILESQGKGDEMREKIAV